MPKKIPNCPACGNPMSLNLHEESTTQQTMDGPIEGRFPSSLLRILYENYECSCGATASVPVGRAMYSKGQVEET